MKGLDDALDAMVRVRSPVSLAIMERDPMVHGYASVSANSDWKAGSRFRLGAKRQRSRISYAASTP